MTASELQNRPDFYQLLQAMGKDDSSSSTTTDTAGTISPNDANNNNIGRFAGMVSTIKQFNFTAR
jgi:hypothetical protein